MRQQIKKNIEVDTEEIEKYLILSALTRRKLKTERRFGRWIYCSLKVGRTVDPWLSGQNMAPIWPNYIPATYVMAVNLSFYKIMKAGIPRAGTCS